MTESRVVMTLLLRPAVLLRTAEKTDIAGDLAIVLYGAYGRGLTYREGKLQE